MWAARLARRAYSSSTTPPAMALHPNASKSLAHFSPSGTVFAEFTALANETRAVNLGQGFPSLDVPLWIREAGVKALMHPNLGNQYTRSQGHPRLVQELAKFYEPTLGREIAPMSEILVTVGATEAIFSAIQALVNPGDKVVLIQPYYDSYPASVHMAHGTPVYVSLKPPPGTLAKSADDWTLDLKELRSALSQPNTKLFVLNNPNNPLGKVYTRAELQGIADVLKEFPNVTVMADEVYETLVYEGMWDRTISVGSIGKIFGITGWKIGWCVAPESLIRTIQMVHQWVPFSVATPLQEAAADVFQQASAQGYWKASLDLYRSSRDLLLESLKAGGLGALKPRGGYFVMAGTSSIPDTALAGQRSASPKRDVQVCRFLTTKVGVTPIPPSAFYEPGCPEQALVANLARFAFCKRDEEIRACATRLRDWSAAQKA